MERGKVGKPAGFFITAIRNTWRERNGVTDNFSVPAPRFNGEPGYKRRKHSDRSGEANR
jgi:hypothetical protein